MSKTLRCCGCSNDPRFYVDTCGPRRSCGTIEVGRSNLWAETVALVLEVDLDEASGSSDLLPDTGTQTGIILVVFLFISLWSEVCLYDGSFVSGSEFSVWSNDCLMKDFTFFNVSRVQHGFLLLLCVFVCLASHALGRRRCRSWVSFTNSTHVTSWPASCAFHSIGKVK